MKNMVSFRCVNPLYTCFITKTVIAAAGWQPWIMFYCSSLKKLLKPMKAFAILSVYTVLFWNHVTE